MDVRAENRGRPHQKVGFPAAAVMGRNFLTPGHPGVRVGNVRRKFGPKGLCLCCFFLPDWNATNHGISRDGGLALFSCVFWISQVLIGPPEKAAKRQTEGEQGQKMKGRPDTP